MKGLTSFQTDDFLKYYISALAMLMAQQVFGQIETEIVVTDISLQNKTFQNVPIEFTFTTQIKYEDPFNTVDLDLIIAGPDGTTQRVPAFWAGDDKWKVRYSSSRIGEYFWSSECSNRKDTSLNQKKGTLEVLPYNGKLELFKRGPIRVAKDLRHFEHEDGTPFFWMGDTCGMALSRMKWPNDFKELVADRKEKGFNVVQVVAGLFPEFDEPLPEYAANEGGLAWEKDFSHLRPKYFDAADKRIKYLIEQGITPCIVGVWGYFMPWMGEAKIKAHWRYLIARYGAYPVVWISAGEANLPYYKSKKFPDDVQGQARRWSDVSRYIRTIDPYSRLLSCHPTAWNFFTARHAVDDESILDFDFLQTPHGANYYDGKTPIEEVVFRTVMESRAAGYPKPIINGENSYDMHAGLTTPDVPRHNFWICIANGAAGHTYGANGIWQVNGNGDTYFRYGNFTWEDALDFEGAKQIGGAKKWLEKLPWSTFQPYYNWAKWTEGSEIFRNEVLVPFALGNINGIRLFYMVKAKSVNLYQLKPGCKYKLTYFDPVKLEETDEGSFLADNSGNATLNPPKYDHDWIALVEPME